MRKVIILLFTAMLQFSWAGLTINGTIKNAQGKAQKFADAHLMLLGETTPFKSVHADKQGNFSISAEDGKLYTLYLTAADHQGLNIPILSEKENQALEMEIQLQANKYKANFDDVKIIGDWNKFNFRNAEKMERQDDGTFKYTVTSDAKKVAYQLLGIDTNNHSVNGTMNDDFEYDGGGDYRSIVKTTNGKVDIIFEPKKVFSAQNMDTPRAIFPKNKPLNTISSIEIETENIYQDFRKKHSAYFAQNKNLKGFDYDFSEIESVLLNYINTDNPLVRRYAALKYVSLAASGLKNADYNKIITTLPATDQLWAKIPHQVFIVYSNALGDKQANKVLSEQFNKIESRKVKGYILAFEGMIAQNKDDQERVKNIYTQLSENYSDIPDLKYYLAQLDPNKAITKGKQVPEFNVQLIHSDEMVSRESMLGTFYLLDFWAVWCGPCRAEMPNIHEAYKEFKSNKFEILSLSFDPKISAVDKYRKETWPMPWLHTFVEKGFKNELSKRFEVNGIPKPILVNDKGIIIATGSELRGKSLKEALNKFLNTTM
jgi:thiol-disulfide isomerase/thioredoxin